MISVFTLVSMHDPVLILFSMDFLHIQLILIRTLSGGNADRNIHDGFKKCFFSSDLCDITWQGSTVVRLLFDCAHTLQGRGHCSVPLLY